MKTYIWAQDTGHAWLAVKRKELDVLGIADLITSCSYVKGSTVYLEEDVDAPSFIAAYEQKHGVKPTMRSGKMWDRNPCRSFASYEAPAAIPAGAEITQQEVVDAINVRHLADYMEQRKSWMKIFDKETDLTFPLTQDTVKHVVDLLNGDLSPENLHCDGEISPAQARAKYDFYKLVAEELEAYCKNNGLQMEEVYEL